MLLNLDRYQVGLPYPSLHHIRPDKELADKLIDGYSGKKSELTTVLQYAYHSLQCRHKYNDISAILRGIFYVETLHMELLGDCIAQLGGDTHYNLAERQNAGCWQANLVDYESEPAAILHADMEGEQYAVRFYMETAALCKQPEISHLLLRLAEDEKLHYRMFSNMYQQSLRYSGLS